MNNEFNTDNLMLLPNGRRLEYKSKRGDKTSIAWGQRKLLMSEIEFFTIYWDDKKIPNPHCVYAGAAPGDHIVFLSKMFPSFTFDLYDPRDFSIEPIEGKINIYKQYFTNEEVEKYKDKDNIFFLSDIRTDDYIDNHKTIGSKYGYNIKFDNYNNLIIEKFGSNIDLKDLPKPIKNEIQDLTEKNVFGDMQLQQEWIKIMNPEHALIKFRLPYYYNNTDVNKTYLKGVVYWQPWAPQSSTETRLKPIRNKQTNKYEEDLWNIREYEEWCSFHNVEVRCKNIFNNIFTENEEPFTDELLNDYDSTCEAMILKLYFDKFCHNNQNKYEMVKILSKEITLFLNTDQKSKKTRNISLNDIRSSGKNKYSLYVKSLGHPKTKNILEEKSETVLFNDGYNSTFDFTNQISNQAPRFKLC